ncbi:MAG: oxidoreductase [Phycisphaeraceae bacterium]|nr:oxidoreductase [Phycisphaeraceae bacterium]
MRKRRAVFLCLALAASCGACARSRPIRVSLDTQNGDVPASLRGVFAVSESECLASGSDGTVLRTADAGHSWSPILVPGSEGLDFRDVHAPDDSTILLLTAGTPARIYRSEDRGRTWEIVHEDSRPEAFFDAMDFWDSHRGVVLGDPIDGVFTILLTSDGGRTWTSVDAARIPRALPGEIAFAASGTCLATGPDGLALIGLGGSTGLASARVLRSTSWGASWSASESGTPTGESSGIFSIAIQGHTAVAVGGDYASPSPAEGGVAVMSTRVSHDGGRTWQAPIAQTPIPYRSAVAAGRGPSGPVLLSAGFGGPYFAADPRAAFGPLEDPDNRQPHAVSFAPNSGVAWLVGAQGRITRAVIDPKP